MLFEEALKEIREGRAFRRAAWPAKESVSLVHPGHVNKAAHAMVYKRTALNNVVPFVVEREDLLAEDWEDLDPKPAEEPKAAEAAAPAG